VCVCSLRYPACNALAILSSVASPALQCFSTLSHKWNDFFGGEVIAHKMCVCVFFYNVCMKHFSFWEELSEMWSKMYIGFHVKYPLFLSDCNETWIFLKHLKKYIYISNFITICPLGAQLFHVDRQTDRHDKDFSNFANAPKRQRTQQMLLLLVFIITIIIVMVADKTC